MIPTMAQTALAIIDTDPHRMAKVACDFRTVSPVAVRLLACPGVTPAHAGRLGRSETAGRHRGAQHR